MKKIYNIQRFPKSSDKSLKAWSAADEYLIKLSSEHINSDSKISIINDRFGYLSIYLHANNPNIITHFKSQENAILQNFELNEISSSKLNLSHLFEEKANADDVIILKIPKSMGLFHLFLMEMHKRCKANTKIFCGFMTRHFTKQMILLASRYFEDVNQSLAWKKSRVLTLSSPKSEAPYIEPIHTIPFQNHRGEKLSFQQYYGVFSSNHIDYATQFLLQNLKVDSSINKVLDLASGNGVIAHEIRMQAEEAEIHLVDDSYLAIESSKLNLKNGNYYFQYNHHLEDFEDGYFDLVVCNPPFHFEHENTIEIAFQLFEGVSRILDKDGSFLLVSNLHLNYKTQLRKIFNSVEVLNMNSKFEVIKCQN